MHFPAETILRLLSSSLIEQMLLMRALTSFIRIEPRRNGRAAVSAATRPPGKEKP
jgi:hypothetical protein